MLTKTISALLMVIGIIHLLPLSGIISAERLTTLYGIPVQEANIEILMRHRAVLFGLLGAFFIYAAFDHSVQPIAFIAAFVSMVSFLYLAWSVGGFNPALKKVVVADIIALLCLAVAVAMYLYKFRIGQPS